MITQQGLRKGTELRKFVIGAHPIIQVYIERLRIPDLIATYIQQDRRIKIPIERTLVVLIHNILTTPMPMYEIAGWLAPLDEKSLDDPGQILSPSFSSQSARDSPAVRAGKLRNSGGSPYIGCFGASSRQHDIDV